MRAAREQAQAILGLVEDFALGQDAPADADDGVGGEHQRGPDFVRASSATAAAMAAFSALSRCASARGDSLRSGVSSISAGMTASGSTPICASSARRRGEPEASTSAGADSRSRDEPHGRSVPSKGAYLKR